MKRALCLLLALTLLVPFSPTPAHAGCCDDFWGCVGAVVTGGLSCAVQEAVEAISNFVKMVRDVRDKGKAEMEAAFAKHKEAAQEAAKEARDQMQQMVAAMDQYQKDAQKAARDVQTIKAIIPLGGGLAAVQKQTSVGAAASAPKVPTPGAAAAKSGGTAQAASAAQASAGKAPSASVVSPGASRDIGGSTALALKLGDPGQITNAMKEGEKQVSAERDKMRNQKAQAMEAKAKQTETDAAQRVTALQSLLNAAFVAPLAGIIAFFAVGDPVTLAVGIAIMTAQLNAVKKALNDQVDPAVAKASDDQQKLIDEMEQHANEANQGVDNTKQTVELMQKLEKTKRQGDLEALEKHLGIKHVTTMALAPGALQTPMIARRVAFKGAALHLASKEHAVATSRKLRVDLDAPIALATTFKKPTPPPVAGFQSRVSTDLETQFRGRAGAALTQKRDDLIAEARVYFAKDPKTLEAVEKYLREQAATRGGR